MKKKLHISLPIFYAIILLFLTQNLYATTEKYRLSLRSDPATTITIGWNQVSGSNPTVYYGTTDHGTNYTQYTNTHGVDRTVSHKGMDNRFARLTGLTPNTVYYFVIVDSDGPSARFSFRTLPNSPSEKLSIIAGGDSRNNRTPRQRANTLVAKLRPHAVMFGGDYTNGNTNSEWDEWFDDWQNTIASDGRMTAIIATRGNHESSNSDVYNLFDVPSTDVYYGLTLGGSLLRVYTLNTETSISGNQSTWLANDLQSNNTAVTWKFAQYHKPMRPHTSSKAEGNTQYNSWSGLFNTYNVKLVVECDAHTVKTTWPVVPSTGTGSDEGFIRDDINGTVYVGEGCWGAPLRSNNDDKNWTRNSGQFNHVNWIFVDQNNVEARKIEVDNSTSSGSNTDATRFSTPTGLSIWNPSNGSVITIPAASSNIIPTVSITSPANGTNYATPQSITISANAADSDGTISSVEFFESGSLIGTDNSAPYSINWTIPANGSYALTAKATDNDGGIAYSSQVDISSGSSFNLSRQISSGSDDVEESQSGSMYDNSTDLELVYDSYNSQNNQVVGMRFNNITIPQGATITNAYIQFTCDETSSGSTSLTIEGHDADNSQAFSSSNNDVSSRTMTTANVAWSPAAWNSVGAATANERTPDLTSIVSEIVGRSGWISGNSMTFVITGTGTRTAESYDGSTSGAPELVIDYNTAPPVNQAPIVFFTSPANNTSYSSLATINLEATATDADGILHVNFYRDGILIATDNVAPYETPWTIPAFGSYTLTAEAEDLLGAINTDVIQISAVAPPNQLPTASITAPVTGANFPSPQQITITANAADADGTVSAVEFYQNGQLIGTDNTAPYSLAWTIPNVGNYTLVATAIDDDGDSGSSTPVDITCGSSFTFSKRISTGSDDVEEEDDGTMYTTSSDLELVADGSRGNQTIGLRYTNVTIPNGAFITSAYVQFTVDETNSGTTNLTVEGHAADNSSAFSSSNGDVSSRSKTVANVAWAPPSWSSVGQSGTAQRTPDISALISEIVARPGWSSGNALTLIITGTGERTAESYDGSPSSAPELVVEYSLAPPNVAPTVSIVNPSNNTAYASLANITIDANATDTDGAIASVEFFANGSSIGVDNSSPYSISWTIPSYGSHNLSAIATDDDGATGNDQITISASPPNQAPTAVISGLTGSGFAPLTITPSGATSTDADGSIVSYSWDFGDGTSAVSGIAPVHTYFVSGTYTVTLTVTDDDGATDVTSTPVTVAPPNVMPNSIFTVSSASGQAPHAISVNASASFDSDGSIVDYAWDFGDGTTTNGPASTHEMYNHTYVTGGTFSCQLTVTDNLGGTATSSKTITVTAVNLAPVASASATPSAGQSPLSVSFDGTGSSDADGTIVSYSWDFGDGSSGTGASPSHIYTAGSSGANYTAVLTVTDNQGATATANVSVSVSAPNVAPTAVILATPITGYAPLAVSFDASLSSDADGSITGYYWDFGDGNSATGFSTSHTYTGVGSFTAQLTVTDNQGATHSTTQVITVNTAPNSMPMEWGSVTGVGDSWQTVSVSNSYTNMVVVATAVYANANVDPVVTRVKNASGNSFDLKVQNPGGSTSDSYNVEYVVVEEGTYNMTNHGIKMEAKLESSSSVAYKNNWYRENRSYTNSYSQPVVLGQVMTENDADWSVFWASRYNNRRYVPSNSISGFAAGKHVGEDSDKTRATETIGILVFEAGSGTVNGKEFIAGLTSDFVRGTSNNSSGYATSIAIDAEHAVLSSAAMDGNDGGWPVFSGNGGSSGSSLNMWVDEDQISNSERNHTTENVAYFTVGSVPSSKTDHDDETAIVTAQNVGVSGIVFPNPTQDQFAIKFSDFIGEQVDLQIVDVYGRIVLDKQVPVTGNQTAPISIGHLAKGHYFVVATNTLVDNRMAIVLIN